MGGWVKGGERGGGGGGGAGGEGSFDCLLRPCTSDCGIKAPLSSAGVGPPQVTSAVWKMSSACRNTSLEVCDTLLHAHVYTYMHKLASMKGVTGSAGGGGVAKQTRSVFTRSRGHVWHSFPSRLVKYEVEFHPHVITRILQHYEGGAKSLWHYSRTIGLGCAIRARKFYFSRQTMTETNARTNNTSDVVWNF